MSFNIDLEENNSYLHFFKLFDDCFVADSLTGKILRINSSMYNALSKESDYFSAFVYKKKLRELQELQKKRPEDKVTPTITVFITHRCNLRCSYCFDKQSEPSGYCNVDTVCSKITEIADDGRINVCFFGGEPLLGFEQIRLIVEKCENYKLNEVLNEVQYSITTNAVLLDGSKIKFFNDYDFNVVISADGLEDEHRLIGTRNKTLNLKSIDQIKRLNNYIVKCTVSPEWIPDLSPLLFEFYKHGIKHVAFSPVVDENIVYDQYSQEAWIKELQTLAFSVFSSKLPFDYVYNFKSSLYRIRFKRGLFSTPEYYCNVHAIDLDGKEYFCHRMVAKGEEYSTDSYINTIKNNTNCHFCWARWFCSGMCLYNQEFASEATKRFLCNIYQAEVEVSIWLNTHIGVF